jgi:transcriptional regulator with XRE-family HTH domain
MKSDVEVLKQIGNRFKKLRIQKGYTSYETFAIDHGLSRMQYWRIEKGTANLTIKSILLVLKIHKMSIEEFFTLKP